MASDPFQAPTILLHYLFFHLQLCDLPVTGLPDFKIVVISDNNSRIGQVGVPAEAILQVDATLLVRRCFHSAGKEMSPKGTAELVGEGQRLHLFPQGGEVTQRREQQTAVQSFGEDERIRFGEIIGKQEISIGVDRTPILAPE